MKYEKEFSEISHKLYEIVERLREDDSQNQEEDQQQQDQPQEPENPVAAPVDESVESDEQVELNAQQQQDGSAPSTMPSEAPQTYGSVDTSSTGQPLELSDGTGTEVAQDASMQYDAISPDGEASISFEHGNFENFYSIPNKVNSKIATVQKTVLPLVEVGLIELLGNNKAFVGENFNATFTMNGDEPTIECQATYRVDLFIGTDINQEDIAHDAKYLLDRVKVVPNVRWNHLEIDCTEGKVNLDFVL